MISRGLAFVLTHQGPRAALSSVGVLGSCLGSWEDSQAQMMFWAAPSRQALPAFSAIPTPTIYSFLAPTPTRLGFPCILFLQYP